MFEININRDKHRVELTIGKFLGLDLLVESESELREGVASILRDRPDFDLLVCVGNLGPASQDASAKMSSIFTHFISGRLRKAAHVSVDPIARLQLRRVTKKDPRVEFFSDRAAAESWLDV